MAQHVDEDSEVNKIIKADCICSPLTAEDKWHQVHVDEQLEKTMPAQRWQPKEQQNFVKKTKRPQM